NKGSDVCSRIERSGEWILSDPITTRIERLPVQHCGIGRIVPREGKGCRLLLALEGNPRPGPGEAQAVANGQAASDLPGILSEPLQGENRLTTTCLAIGLRIRVKIAKQGRCIWPVRVGLVFRMASKVE